MSKTNSWYWGKHWPSIWIKVSSESVIHQLQPQFFLLKKPGRNLRFCVDYRNFNRITKKDKYFLPLIYETFRSIGKTKWYIKFDVKTVFHKIKITEKNEWMTTFRTKYNFFRMARDSVRFSQCFSHFSKTYQLGSQGFFKRILFNLCWWYFDLYRWFPN